MLAPVILWAWAVVMMAQRADSFETRPAKSRFQHCLAVFAGLITITVSALLVMAAFIVWFLTASTYVVLTPASPDGCQIVVQRHSTLLAEDGKIFVKIPAHLVLETTAASWNSVTKHGSTANPEDWGFHGVAMSASLR